MSSGTRQLPPPGQTNIPRRALAPPPRGAMPPPRRYTVDHGVRLVSHRDGVELAASVFLPTPDAVDDAEPDESSASAKKRTDDRSRVVTPRSSDAASSASPAPPPPRHRHRLEKHGFVMVHAHPKFGGSPEMMHALAADMASHGASVVNLALRGAGGSGGAASWQGDAGEVSDVLSAADHARDQLGCEYVHLLGYSFGATVAGAAIDQRDFIATYVALAYPLGHWWSRGVFGVGAKLLMHRHTAPLKDSVKPKLFVIGTEDEFTSAGGTERFARKCAEPREVIIIEGADHFGFVAGEALERVAADARRFARDHEAYVDATAGRRSFDESDEEREAESFFADVYKDVMTPPRPTKRKSEEGRGGGAKGDPSRAA